MVSAHFTWSYFIVDYSVMINYAINILICSILVIGGFSIGTTLTGTPIANIIASIGILIAPKVFIVIFTELITGETLTLASSSTWFIFKEESNILFATLFDIFSDEGSILAVLNSASVYTLTLAIIYIIIGLFLFVTRPSETAAKSFRNKKIFTFVKYATGFSISLILVADIFNDYDQLSEHIIEYALLVVGIGLSMFAIEAAYSKSIKSGLKSLIATPLVLLVDVALLFGMTAFINHYDAEKINGDDVNYMYVDFDYYYYLEHVENVYMGYGYMYEFDHFYTKLCDTKITDQKIIDYLLDIYNSDRVDKVAANPYHEFRRLEVTFDSAYGDKTRNVYLTDVEFNTIGQMLLEDKNIQKAMIFYPESNSLAMLCPLLTREETHTLYKTLIKELNSLEIDGIEYLKFCSGHSDITSAGTLYIEFIDNGHICYYEHTISPLTPETYALYMTYINRSNKADILEIINRIDKNRDETRVYFSGQLYNILTDDSSTEYYSYHRDTTAKELDESYTIIKDAIMNYYNNSDSIDSKDVFSEEYYITNIHVIYGSYEYDKDDTLNAILYVPISKNSELFKYIETIQDIEDGERIEFENEDEFKNENKSDNEFQTN